MEDYPANSRAAKKRVEEPRTKAAPKEKKIEKVVTGSVVQRKRSLGKRFHDTFIGSDSRSVGQYIVMDVLVPATKDMIHDVITSYVERMLFPDSRPVVRRRASSSGGGVGRINYSSSSSIRRDPREEERRRHVSSGSRSRHDFGEIVLEKRVEAEEVIDRMAAQIEEYGQVSVADLYDMVDVTSAFTDNKWGWYDLEGARVRYVRNGYLLDLPRPVDFD
jgi:hypothetical protein